MSDRTIHLVRGQNEVQPTGEEFTGLGIYGSFVEVGNDIGDALYRAIPKKKLHSLDRQSFCSEKFIKN